MKQFMKLLGAVAAGAVGMAMLLTWWDDEASDHVRTFSLSEMQKQALPPTVRRILFGKVYQNEN